MSARLIVPAMLGAFLLGTPAFAVDSGSNTESWRDRMPDSLSADPSPTAPSTAPPSTALSYGLETQQAAVPAPADRCTALRRQFETAIATHRSAPLAGEARVMSENGGELCASGFYREGIDKVRQAITELGVAAKS